MMTAATGGAHPTLAVFAALACVVAGAWCCGRLAQRVGQPRVVGELVAGVVLGPALAAVAPSVQAGLFTDELRADLGVLSSLGLTLYMFLVGAAAHGGEGRVGRRKAVVLSVAGIVPSFVLGALLGFVFVDVLAPSPREHDVWLLALFLGAALAVTAFPLLARILDEEQLSATPLGRLALTAAAIDDVVAWTSLAVVVTLASAGSWVGAVSGLLGTAVVVIVMLRWGRRAMEVLARRVRQRGRLGHDDLAVVLVLVLACAWATEAVGGSSVFGGFVAGMAVPRCDVFRRALRASLHDMTVVLLVPLFFVLAGLSIDVRSMQWGGLLLPLAAVLAASFVGKIGGVLLVRAPLELSLTSGLALGGLMNARGLMLLVFTSVGQQHGLVTPPLATVLVSVALVTSAAALPLYRRCSRDESDVPTSTPSALAQVQ